MSRILNLGKLVLAGYLLPVAAFAAEEGMASGGNSGIAIAIGIAMGLAVFGAALGQGKIAAAFMEGVSRNPGAANAVKTQMILALVFVETLVLFAVLISFILSGKM